MAPWNLFSGSGIETEQDLPKAIEPNVRGVDTAFELFIDGALTKVYNESSGRSKEQKALRAACKKILGKAPLMAHACVPFVRKSREYHMLPFLKGRTKGAGISRKHNWFL